jgi:hypothetical protein
MHEIDRRMDLLHRLLADVNARREQAEHAHAQVRVQMDQAVDYTITRGGMVGNALAALADLEERLALAAATLRHLELLRRRAQRELDTLLVTRGVMDARARLDELERRRAHLLAPGAAPMLGVAPSGAPIAPAAHSAELAEIAAEMAELHATIEAASDAAVRALTGAQRPNAGTGG